MRRLVLLPLLLLAPAALLAESAMPRLGYTGAPADHGGQTCSTCHNSFGAANSDPAGSLTVSVTDYNPGVLQTIRISVQHPGASRWGFQITIREESDETVSAGTFSLVTPTDPVQVACDDGTLYGSAGPCGSDIARQFAEQLNAPRSSSSPYEFDVQWTPPVQEIGRLHVYVAAVAADADNTAQGDRVYTYTQTLNNIGGCSLSPKPTLQTAMNGASFHAPLSSNAMISVFGSGFQTSGRKRAAGLGDFVNGAFPDELGCVAVEVTGPGVAQPVRLPIAYVQSNQINAQLPEFIGAGPIMLRVLLNPGPSNQLASDWATLNSLQPFAPAFFLFAGSNSIAAEFAGSASIVANPSVVPGATPAKPGQLISLFGTGFGDTNPLVPAGRLATGQATLTNSITVTIGTVTLQPSDVLYAGLSPGSISGLYQFNVRVPAATPNGDIPVTISVGGLETQAGATIPVQQ